MPKTIPDPMTTNGRMISKNAESNCLVVSDRSNSIGHQRILHLRFVSIIKHALFKLNLIFSFAHKLFNFTKEKKKGFV